MEKAAKMAEVETMLAKNSILKIPEDDFLFPSIHRISAEEDTLIH